MYNEEQIQGFKKTIINEISKGKSLRKILRKNKSLPSRPTIYSWLYSGHKDFDEDFLDQYARAKADSADLDAEKVKEIADKTLKGKYPSDVARVAIDAYKWSAGKKKPKKYGDSSLLKLGDQDGNPLRVNAIFQNDLMNVPTDDSNTEDSQAKKED